MRKINRHIVPILTTIVLLASGLLLSCAETTPNRLPESDAPPSQSAPALVPEQPKMSSSAFRLSDVVEHPEYWNADWGASKLYQLLCSINSLYHRKHTYIEGVFDCNDMAVDIWDILQQQGITSIIGVGNLSVDKESFAECDHAWLIIIHKDEYSLYRIFIIEPTNGETYPFDPKTMAFAQYLQGFFYSSPSDLRAGIRERW